MRKISTESIVQREDRHLIHTELNEDLVMMDLENGSYLSLNRTGRIIWKEIEKPVVVKDLIIKLRYRFSIDEETCTSETIKFLIKMEKQNVLKIL